MNTELVYLALIQMILSIFLAIVIFYISYKLLFKIFKLKETELNTSNLALSIFFSAIIFSIGYLLSGIIPSIISATEVLQIQNGEGVFLQILKYASISLLVGFLFALIIHTSSFFLLRALTTQVKEVEELKKNNIALALLLASIIISITIISRDSLLFIIDLFLPQPNVIEFT